MNVQEYTKIILLKVWHRIVVSMELARAVSTVEYRRMRKPWKTGSEESFNSGAGSHCKLRWSSIYLFKYHALETYGHCCYMHAIYSLLVRTVIALASLRQVPIFLCHFSFIPLLSAPTLECSCSFSVFVTAVPAMETSDQLFSSLESQPANRQYHLQVILIRWSWEQLFFFFARILTNFNDQKSKKRCPNSD